MSIDQLAALDAAERLRLHEKAIADVRHAIELRRQQSGRTDVLERQLAELLAKSAPWR